MTQVVINLKGLERQIQNLTKLDMLKIGQEAFKLNSEQIQKKRNRDGSRFISYTEAYAKRKGVSVGAVDLVSKARGLSASAKKRPYRTMRINYNVLTVERYKVTLGFSNLWDRQKAEWIVTGGKSPSRKRPFVGLQKKNRKELRDFAFRLMTKGTY